MTRQDLHHLVQFNFWARDRIVDAARQLSAEQYTRDMGNSFRSVRDTLVHLYSAEWVWLSRWEGTSPATPISPADYPDLDSLMQAWHELEPRFRDHVAAVGDDVERVIDYRLMNGTPGRSAFWQMLQHVVNHGTYHRGQVTTMLRQLGVPPPKSTDLIAYYREH
jgi:uncharacterized damage-inducible protein DinB